MQSSFIRRFVVLASVLCLSVAAFAQAPKLALDSDTYEFGQVAENAEITHTFIVKNAGGAELIIKNVSPACGCTASDFSKQIAPGQEGLVKLTVKTAGMMGKTERYADIISNDPANPFQKLWLRFEVTKAATNAGGSMSAKSVYDFSLKTIDGKPMKLDSLKGKVVLLVNVASKCGYTPQYTGLQALYTKYKDQGLVVLGVPANNFGGQEPGTEAEIKEFCTAKYNVTFPLTAKVSVKGADIDPLFAFLTDKAIHPTTGGDLTWNFNKFLIGRDGRVLDRFASGDKPEDTKVTQAIEAALKK
jgi:glutathione peroxidase